MYLCSKNFSHVVVSILRRVYSEMSHIFSSYSIWVCQTKTKDKKYQSHVTHIIAVWHKHNGQWVVGRKSMIELYVPGDRRQYYCYSYYIVAYGDLL